MAAQCQHHLTGNLLRAHQCQVTHLLRLPGFTIIAIFLTMSYRRAEMDAINCADGKQGDFKIKIHYAFDDNASGACPASLLSIVPGLGEPIGGTNKALSLPGGTHYRLHNAGVADFGDGLTKAGFAVSKAVRRGRQRQFFGGQSTDPLAVHGQLRRPGTRHDALAFLFQCYQHICGNRLYFGHDIIWFFTLHELA